MCPHVVKYMIVEDTIEKIQTLESIGANGVFTI